MKLDSMVRLLIDRTNLKIPFAQFMGLVSVRFPSVGAISSFSPINEGYEDANFILDTTQENMF